MTIQRSLGILLCFILQNVTYSYQVPWEAKSRVPEHSKAIKFSSAVNSVEHNRALTRIAFLQAICIGAILPATAFEGGIGGLGKTKPETGVVFLSDPVASNGFVTGELLLPDGIPALVSFQIPKSYQLLAGGLEGRDIQTADSAFVQVVDRTPQPTSTSQLKSVLLDSLLSAKGKFGAYGSPTDVKVKNTDSLDLFVVTFTTLTPGLRESDRKVYIRSVAIGTSLLLFVVGGTRQRFSSQEASFRLIVDSFQAVAAPATKLATSK